MDVLERPTEFLVGGEHNRQQTRDAINATVEIGVESNKEKIKATVVSRCK